MFRLVRSCAAQAIACFVPSLYSFRLPLFLRLFGRKIVRHPTPTADGLAVAMPTAVITAVKVAVAILTPQQCRSACASSLA